MIKGEGNLRLARGLIVFLGGSAMIFSACQTPGKKSSNQDHKPGLISRIFDDHRESQKSEKPSQEDLIRAVASDPNSAIRGAAPNSNNCVKSSSVDRHHRRYYAKDKVTRDFTWKPGQGPRDAACGNRYTNIKASHFAGAGDDAFSKTSAYTEERIDANQCVCALPKRFPFTDTKNGAINFHLPILKLTHGSQTTFCRVEDIGPHYGSKLGSDAYWTNSRGNGCRPKSEEGNVDNKAGIDLTPGCFRQLGGNINSGFMTVDWSFI